MTEIARYTASASGYNCSYIIGYDLLSQNVENRYSTIRLYAQIEVKGYYISWSSGSASLYGNTFVLATQYNQGITTVFQKDVNIYHEADGSKTVYIDGSINTTYVMKGSCGGNITLPKIPVASTIGCSDFYIESSTNIVINSASNSFRHTLKYNFGSLSGTIVEKTSQTIYAWTPDSNEFYQQIPNSQQGVGTITCETYNGNVLLGTKTCNFTARVDVNKNKPDVDLIVIDTNEDTKALTGNENKLIKFFSNAKATITASAKNHATIKSYQINNANAEQVTTINNVETNKFTAKVIDSRDIENSSDEVVTNFVDYIKLAIKSLEIERTSPTSDQVRLSLDGFYFNDTFGQVSNNLEVKMKYKQAYGEWSEYKNITPNITEDNIFDLAEFDLNTLFDNASFDYQKAYTFEIVINDKLMTVNQEIQLKRGLPLVAYGEDFIHLYETLELPSGNEVLDYEVVSERSLKLKENKYWDSSSVVHKKKNLNNLLNTLILYNTVNGLNLGSGASYHLDLPDHTLFIEILLNSNGSRESGGNILTINNGFSYFTNTDFSSNGAKGIYANITDEGDFYISEYNHCGAVVTGFRIWYLNI